MDDKFALGISGITTKVAPSFWYYFRKIPLKYQQEANHRFTMWQDGADLDIHRMNRDRAKVGGPVDNNNAYRALGVREGNVILWYWIGQHKEYERLIDREPIPPTVLTQLQQIITQIEKDKQSKTEQPIPPAQQQRKASVVISTLKYFKPRSLNVG